MCLAFPAKIVELDGNDAVVEFQNVKRKVRTELIGECEIGDHVLIHAGFAINKLDKQAAKETMETWDELLKTLSEEDLQNSKF